MDPSSFQRLADNPEILVVGSSIAHRDLKVEDRNSTPAYITLRRCRDKS
jgi:hypothetical protein